MLKEVNPFDLFVSKTKELSYKDFFDKFDNLIKFIFSLGPITLQLFFFNKLTEKQKLYILLKHCSEENYFTNLDELADNNYYNSVDCVKENISHFTMIFDEIFKQSLEETNTRKYKLLYLIDKKKYKEHIENIEKSKIIVNDIAKAKEEIKKKYAKFLSECNEKEIQILVKNRDNEIESLFLESKLDSLVSILKEIDIAHSNTKVLIRMKSRDFDKGKSLNFDTISKNSRFVLFPIGAIYEINSLLEKELAELSDVNEILKRKKQAKLAIDNIIDINDIRYTLKQSISNSTEIDNLSLRKLLSYYDTLIDDKDTLKTLIEYLLHITNEEVTNLFLRKCPDIDYDILCLINKNANIDNLQKLLMHFDDNPKVEKLMTKEDFVSISPRLSHRRNFLHIMLSFQTEGGGLGGSRCLSYVLNLSEGKDRTGEFKLMESIPGFRPLDDMPLCFTNDEDYIIYEDKLKLKLYRTMDFKDIYSLEKKHNHYYKFSKDGKSLAIVDFDNYLFRIVDINCPKNSIYQNFREKFPQKVFNIKQIPVSNLGWENEAKKEFLYSIEFSPDNRFIALRVGNMKSKDYLLVLRGSNLSTVYEGSILNGHYQFNENGNFVLVKKHLHSLVYDLNSQTIKTKFNSQNDFFFIDDKHILSSYPNTEILRLTDSKIVFTSKFPGIGGGGKPDISPNGRFIVIRQTTWGRVLLITKNFLEEFNEYIIVDYGFEMEGGVEEVKFSSDNKYLAITKRGVVIVDLECKNNFKPKIITRTTEFRTYIDFSVNNKYLCISDLYGVKVLRLSDYKIIFSEKSEKSFDKHGFISADNSCLIIIDSTYNLIKFYDFSDFSLRCTKKINIKIYYDDFYMKVKEQNNSFDLKDLKNITLYPVISQINADKKSIADIITSNSGTLNVTSKTNGKIFLTNTISNDVVFEDKHVVETYYGDSKFPKVSNGHIETMSFSKDDSFFSSFCKKSCRLHISKIEDVGYFSKKIFIEHLISLYYKKNKTKKDEVTKLLQFIISSDSPLNSKQKEYLFSFINDAFLKKSECDASGI